MKRRALRGVGCGPQATAVRLDNGAADGQAHAGALRFGGKEGIEYPIGYESSFFERTSAMGQSMCTHRRQPATLARPCT